MEDKEIAYWSGFVDGEGHITLKKIGRANKGYRVSLGACNTNKGVIRNMSKVFGGKVYTRNYNKERNPKWKIYYDWEIQGNKAKRVIEVLLPFLKVKKKRALISLAFDNKNVKERDILFNLMKKCNQRGRQEFV